MAAMKNFYCLEGRNFFAIHLQISTYRDISTKFRSRFLRNHAWINNNLFQFKGTVIKVKPKSNLVPRSQSVRECRNVADLGTRLAKVSNREILHRVYVKRERQK